jgi:hypothetical protein
VRYLWLSALVGSACPKSGSPPIEPAGSASIEAPSPTVKRALPTSRIAIVGASVSAGFGGAPFGDLFTAAATRSAVASYANIFLFRDPIGETKHQIDQAIEFRADTIVALDLLFWDVYGSTDPRWRDRAVGSALGELERARANGAWIVVGNVPHITTASELFLARDHVPDAATLARYNEELATWAKRERVLLVPFAAWAEPLSQGGEVEIAPGERVPAASLVGPDGLHANHLGAWALLDRLDHFIEQALPDTPAGSLVFVRPSTTN